MASRSPICVVSGLGNAAGTGAACAHLWASKGFKVALVSRPRKDVTDLCDKIKKEGGDARVFSVDAYDHKGIRGVFQGIAQAWPESRIKTAIWNTSQWSMIPFLDIKEEQIQLSVQLNIVA